MRDRGTVGNAWATPLDITFREDGVSTAMKGVAAVTGASGPADTLRLSVSESRRRGPDRWPGRFFIPQGRARSTAPVASPSTAWPTRVKWIIVGALIATVAGWFTPATRPWEVAQSIREALRPDPPAPTDAQWIVRAYMEQTREATFWSRPPTMFPASAALMRNRFAEFDPRRSHPYRKSPLKLWIPQAASEAPVFAGSPVELIGRVQSVNVLWPLQPPLVEWIIQLAPITGEYGSLAYCRFTGRIMDRPEVGDHYVVRGAIIAAGGIDLARGGLADGIYIACSAIRRPYGDIAKFTEMIERTGIDVPEIMRRAQDPAAFEHEFNRQMRRAVAADPKLVASFRDPPAPSD